MRHVKRAQGREFRIQSQGLDTEQILPLNEAQSLTFSEVVF